MFSRKIRLILLGLVVVVTAILIYIRQPSTRQQATRVSGMIQAVEVDLALDLGGQIAAVNVQEGQRVLAGEVLVQLESDLLKAELMRAQEALARAQSEAQLLAASPLAEQRQVMVSEAYLELIQAEQALSQLIENAAYARAAAWQTLETAKNELNDFLASDLQRAHAQAAIATADKQVDQFRRDLSILTTPPSKAALDQAYANQLLAQQAVNDTLEDIAAAQQKLKGGLGPYVPQRFVDDFKKQLRNLIQNLEIKLSLERVKRQNARERYQKLLEPPDPVDLALAEAALARAEAELGQAQREYERVKDGPSPADVAVLEARVTDLERAYTQRSEGPEPQELALAQARVAKARAQLAMAQANTIEEQLAVAQAKVETARAAMAVIQVQVDKLVLVAPVDGVVLQCRVEAGEIAQPGVAIITLGLLDEISLAVFLPQSQYAGLAVGDEAWVRLDAFPGQLFEAVIVDLAAETQSTPRHVADADGQFEPVYQSVLALKDPAGKLRPGMLAEVFFDRP